MILHICPENAWEQAMAAGAYRGDTLSSEGFIHCSTPGQVVEVADYIFKGRRDLILLLIDETKVIETIKFEDAGNGQLYPHIYGALNLDAVFDTVAFPAGADGTFQLPSLDGPVD